MQDITLTLYSYDPLVHGVCYLAFSAGMLLLSRREPSRRLLSAAALFALASVLNLYAFWRQFLPREEQLQIGDAILASPALLSLALASSFALPAGTILFVWFCAKRPRARI
jgi:hypothetical protein